MWPRLFRVVIPAWKRLAVQPKKSNSINCSSEICVQIWGKCYDKKIQRYNFGSDGHIKKPYGNVIDNYKKHEKICSSYKALANSKFLDVNSDYYGVHDHPYKDIDGIIYNSYLKYDEDEDEDTYIGPNSCDKNSINEIPLVINHYYTKSQEEYMKRCKLWVNGGINNHGYRENCEENFKEKDVKDITGYKYIKHTNWYKYV